MMTRLCFGLLWCLAISSLLTAAGPYDVPGSVDMKDVRNIPSNHTQTWEALSSNLLHGWNGLWHPNFATPVTAFGPPIGLVSPQADDATRQAKAHDFLIQMATLFGETTLKLDLVKSDHVLGNWKMLFEEKRDGKPVLGSRAEMTLNARGEAMRWGIRSYSNWPELSVPLLSLAQAAARLQNKIGQPDWLANETESYAAFFPDAAFHGLRPVWEVKLVGPMAHARWEGVVDASTGEILLDWPGVQTDEVSGNIEGEFWFPYDSSPTDTAVFTMETIFINENEDTSDMDGHFSHEVSGNASLVAWLKGPYVDVQNEDAPSSHLDLELTPPFTPFFWTWTTEHSTRAELNAFYHTRYIHSWYKGIDPGFTNLDYSMPVVVNYGSNYENAFWNGYGCYYGSGGATYGNFVMYCDVIYHEYTHGVTQEIYSGVWFPYDGQPGAMNEAWSDYIPCTITNEPLVGEGGLIGGNPLRYMRNLYNNMHFPENWQGEVHADSPFISGALWRIRMALGARMADSLAHYSRYGHAQDFLSYFIEVFEADDDDGDLSNGTPHDETIYDCFGHHGIGPGTDPNFSLENVQWYENGVGGSIGNGNGWPEAGERVELSFQIFNDVTLYPPPAQNVSVAVTCNDPDLTISGGEQNVGDVGPGQVANVNPILIDIPSNAREHWVDVTITISAENTSSVFEQVVRFTVGRPKILLVEDDSTSEVESFVAKAMHNLDVIFDEVALGSQENLADSLLPEPGVAVWLSGNAREGILTVNDQNLLADYLCRGNRVILSGQDIIDDLSGGPFAQNVLEMSVEQDSVRMTSVRPAAGSPFATEDWFLLVGSAGASNQVRASVLAPLGNNHTICNYGRYGTQGVAALDFYGGHGIVFGFGIEAISGMDTSESLEIFLSELLYGWASDILPAESPESHAALPTTVTLGPAFPNPFNAAVKLPYQIPAGHDANLIVFDILGREVAHIALPLHRGTVVWKAESATGLYFAQIRWESGATPAIKLLLLK